MTGVVVEAHLREEKKSFNLAMTSTTRERLKCQDTFPPHKKRKMSTKFGAIDLCCQSLMDIVLIDETQQQQQQHRSSSAEDCMKRYCTYHKRHFSIKVLANMNVPFWVIDSNSI